MRVYRHGPASCLLALLLAVPALAQDPQPLLTAKMAVERAIANSPELSAAREELKAQQDAATQLPLLPNPVLELEGQTGALTNSPDERTIGIAISQELPLSGIPGRRRAVARAETELARLRLEEQTLRLADEARRVWSTVALGSHRLEAVRSQTAIAESLHAAADERFKAGDLPEFEVQLADLDRKRQTLRQAELEAELQTGRRQLARLLGLASEHELPALAPAEPPAIALGEEQLLALAQQQRPELAAQAKEAERDQAALDLARAEALPGLTVALSYSNERSGQNRYGLHDGTLIPGTERSSDHLLGLKVSMPIPLFERNQAERARALGRVSASRHRIEAARRSVAAELRDLLAQHRLAMTALELHRAALGPVARENLQIQQTAFRLGEIGMQPVLDEKRRLAEQQEAELKALQMTIETYSRLVAAAGGTL